MKPEDLTLIKKIVTPEDAEEMATTMGWDNAAQFYHELETSFEEIEGKVWAVEDTDEEVDGDLAIEEVFGISVCGNPSRLYFPEITQYTDKAGKTWAEFDQFC